MNKKIRVLQVLGILEVGGLQKIVLDIIKQLNHDKYQIDICEMSVMPGQWAGYAESLGIKVYQCPWNPGVFSFKRRFNEILKHGNYDVIEVAKESLSGFVVKLAAHYGVPVRITHYHSMNNGPGGLIYNTMYALGKYMVDKYSTDIVGCSKTVLEYHYGGGCLNDSRYKSVYNGIDLDKFFRAEPDVSKLKKEFGVPAKGFVIGTCARLHNVKNPHLSVELVREALVHIPDLYYLWIGDGPELDNIGKLVSDYGLKDRFIFAGHQENVPELLKILDVFVLLSKWEGFPVSLIEAQAAGIPCVVSRINAVTESLCPELHQYCFELSDGLNDFVHGLLLLRQDQELRQQLADAGREFVLKYDISETVKQVEAIYQAGRG